MSEVLSNNKQQAGHELIGQVVSNSMNKTVTILLARQVKHKRYGKYIKRHTKLYVHDENNQCKIGDTIMVRQCRPISKQKTWQLVKVLGTNE